MSEDRLWALVDRARQHDDDLPGQLDFIDNALAQSTLSEVLEVHAGLMSAHRRAYTEELLAAFELAMGYVGDDSFTDARSWLILHGRTTFDRVVADPDELAEILFNDEEVLGLAEQFAAVILEHAETHGDDVELPEDLDNLAGPPVPRDIPGLRARFPRIAASYPRPLGPR